MTDLRKAAEMALDTLDEISESGIYYKESPFDAYMRLRSMARGAIEALRTALAQPDNTSDSATRSADSAESFCKQELHNLMSVAGRMALELECLLLDTKDLSVVSKWWDTGMEALQDYRHYVWSVTHGKDGENFCDTHCVHTDHHPDCELAQPEQEPTVPDNMQDWANLDGDIVWHLIDRHADNWADIKKMMDEFVAAKIASAHLKHEWVSLTDDEIWEWFESNTAITRDGAFRIARAIEVKLREKNT